MLQQKQKKNRIELGLAVNEDTENDSFRFTSPRGKIYYLTVLETSEWYFLLYISVVIHKTDSADTWLHIVYNTDVECDVVLTVIKLYGPGCCY